MSSAWVDDDGASFRRVAFHRLPLAVLAAAAATAAAVGPAGCERLGPLPWIVSLGVVGLPHGAADFAASRATWRGWPLVLVWLAYAGAMAAVAAAFMAVPLVTIGGFAVVSCWHFGAAHLDADDGFGGRLPRTLAVLARGGAVLAVPLAAWPELTATAAADLAALAVGREAAEGLFPPQAVQAVGLALGGIALAAATAEGALAVGRPRGLRAWLRLLVELAVIGCLGWFATPLLAVGAYFLVWHAWRQMRPLAESLTDSPPGSWRHLAAALVRIHLAALPLLLPTWAAIGTLWWLWSPNLSPRDLAIISIGAYLVVTPAHELLGDLLRAMTARHVTPAAGRPPLTAREPLAAR